MRVFVDANIYLSFLKGSSEDMKSLSSLSILINKKKKKKSSVALIFPEITLQEFMRNYPKIARDHLKANHYKTITELHGLRPQVPAVSRAKSKKKTELEKKFEEIHELLKEEFDKYINKVDAHVTEVTKFHASAMVIPEIPDDLSKARDRRYRGNPPGKSNGALGDEITWELILRTCTDDDLAIVSEDADWRNVLSDKLRKNTVELNPQLYREWHAVSKKKISIYRTLGAFIMAHTNDVTISPDEIQEEHRAAQSVESSLASLATGSIRTDNTFSNSGVVNWTDYASGSVPWVLNIPPSTDGQVITSVNGSPLTFTLTADDGEKIVAWGDNVSSLNMWGTKKCEKCGVNDISPLQHLCLTCEFKEKAKLPKKKKGN